MKILFLTDFVSDNWGNEPEDTIHIQAKTDPCGFEESVQLAGDVLGHPVLIVASFRNSADVVRLLLATDALRRLGCASISLFTTFMPYSRYDKVRPGFALPARVFADLINSQQYRTVTSLLPHGHSMTGMLNNYMVMNTMEPFRAAMADAAEDSIICAPDADAHERTEYLAQALQYDRDILYATITRKDGIPTVSYFNGPMVRGRDVVLLDDICDTGDHHIAVAKRLKSDYGARRVILGVTHGIFSLGIDHLLNNGIDAIHTTNSVMHPACAGQEERINRIELRATKSVQNELDVAEQEIVQNVSKVPDAIDDVVPDGPPVPIEMQVRCHDNSKVLEIPVSTLALKQYFEDNLVVLPSGKTAKIISRTKYSITIQASEPIEDLERGDIIRPYIPAQAD